MTKAEKQAALEIIAQEIAADKSLPLREVATNPVPGEGNPNADILFIGEAPGKDEDLQGRPFVGAAGKLLTKLIESIGLKREDVFIGNILKHRPPNNRDPLPDEITAYTPYLARQISVIKPKIIVTLGRFSMAYLLGEGLSITKIHGQPKRLPPGRPAPAGTVVMPVYHPAAALYRREWQPVLEADFKKIPKIIELIKKGNVERTPAKESKKEKQASLL